MIGSFVNIGERTNVTGSARFRKLIQAEDYAGGLEVARQQIEAGAQIIDINMDDGLLDSEAAMKTFMKQADRGGTGSRQGPPKPAAARRERGEMPGRAAGQIPDHRAAAGEAGKYDPVAVETETRFRVGDHLKDKRLLVPLGGAAVAHGPIGGAAAGPAQPGRRNQQVAFLRDRPRKTLVADDLVAAAAQAMALKKDGAAD